jgi:hypothetical protein
MTNENAVLLCWIVIAGAAIAIAVAGFLVNVFTRRIAQEKESQRALIDAKRDQQWAPARKAVLAEVANTYAAIFYAARSIPFPYDKLATDIPSPTYYQSDRLMLVRSKEFISRLQESIKLNNTALDSELLPKLTAFVGTAGKLNALLEFFAEFQNPFFVNFDFVSEGPSLLLRELSIRLTAMHELYPDTLVPKKDIPGNLMTPDELDRLWENFGKSCHRLSFKPQNYVWHDSTPVAVFNNQALRDLALPKAEHTQNGVKVFFGFQ